MYQGNWIETEKELPEEDGGYEICNHPELENDNLRRECTTTAFYDGYGFQWLGVYRFPKWWRKYQFGERKYGKIQEKKMDKKIKKVKKVMDKKLNALVKEDIPRDKKIKKCDMEMKHKKM